MIPMTQSLTRFKTEAAAERAAEVNRAAGEDFVFVVVASGAAFVVEVRDTEDGSVLGCL